MKTIPVHRTTIIRPFTTFLSEIGAPVSRMLQQVKLPTLALDDPDYYISSLAFWMFVEKMIAKEGMIMHFRQVVLHSANVNNTPCKVPILFMAKQND